MAAALKRADLVKVLDSELFVSHLHAAAAAPKPAGRNLGAVVGGVLHTGMLFEVFCFVVKSLNKNKQIFSGVETSEDSQYSKRQNRHLCPSQPSTAP